MAMSLCGKYLTLIGVDKATCVNSGNLCTKESTGNNGVRLPSVSVSDNRTEKKMELSNAERKIIYAKYLNM